MANNNVGAYVKRMTVVVLAMALSVVLAAALGAGFLGQANRTHTIDHISTARTQIASIHSIA